MFTLFANFLVLQVAKTLGRICLCVITSAAVEQRTYRDAECVLVSHLKLPSGD